MDAIELKLMEALSKAAIAEATATKALSLVHDLMAEVKLLKATPPPAVFDPFGITEPSSQPVPSSTAKETRLSPFVVARPFKQTAQEASQNLDKPASEDEVVKNVLWDDATQ